MFLQLFVFISDVLQNKYPSVKEGYPYLCSGGIIGYASTLWQALNAWQVANTDDDQLYYTLIYLNETLRVRSFLFNFFINILKYIFSLILT